MTGVQTCALPISQQQDQNQRANGTNSTYKSVTEITSGVPGPLTPTAGGPAGQTPFTASQLPSSGGSGQYKQYPEQVPDDTRSIQSGEYQNPNEYFNPDELGTMTTSAMSATEAGGQAEGEGEHRAQPDRPENPEGVGPDGTKLGNRSKVQ